MWENFLAHLPKHTATNLIDRAICRVGEQRQVLVVNHSGRFLIEDCLFAAQPVDPGPFLLGSREWWGDQEPQEQVDI